MRLGWSEDDRAEREQLLTEAWAAGESTRWRVDHLLSGVRDAVQAQRQWAVELEDEALRSGLASTLKRWAKKRGQLTYRQGDRVVTRPSVVGVRRAGGDGAQHAVQLDLEILTADELDAKRDEYLRQVATYTDNLRLVDALRALLDAVPGASSPREAAAKLGTTVESWLLGDAA